MRTYGRITDELGNKTWVVVSTDANGSNDYVYITTLIQVLKLNLGEAPFWARHGIPARDSLLQQLQPDYYVAFTQAYFAPYFASLIISKMEQPVNDPTPRYNVYIIRNNGSIFEANIAV